MLDLFHDVTGLHLRTWWDALGTEVCPGDLAELCHRARHRRAGKLPAACKLCALSRWLSSCDGIETEKRVTGRCGAINYCARIGLLGRGLLTLLVQRRAATSNAERRSFKRAVSLARLVVHDLRATLKVECGGPAGPPSGLRRGGFRVAALQTRRTSNHTRRIVEAMLDYVRRHYCEPMQLGDLAAAMSLNAAYVSDLFSTTTGMTFHHYLEELRLSKAKELLRNPVKRVREVAREVGYTNPNHFRNVFRARVGLAPSAWRQACV
jgi:AraC-like DNA-binding protein